MNYFSDKKGFTLLVSSLIASLMLVVGLAIFNISFKEIQLSITARDSQLAFYAADAGLECALYWDFAHPTFPESVFATSTNYLGTVNPSIVCAGADISSTWDISNPSPTINSATTRFTVSLANGTCALVSIEKSGSPSVTRVESRGQTLCGTNSPRRIERALRAKY